VVAYALVSFALLDHGNSGAGPSPVSLTEGLAAVVGVNDNRFADWVYLVVEHPAKSTTFKAVLGWERRRSGDRSNFDSPSLPR
jgi:hypothetical protein